MSGENKTGRDTNVDECDSLHGGRDTLESGQAFILTGTWALGGDEKISH